MKVQENVSISSLTTMRLGGSARFVVTVSDVDDIMKALDFAKERNLPFWFMGGGANTIGHDDGFNGVIILNRLTGIEVLDESDTEITIKGMGGVVWDDFVSFACEKGYSGIEAMSMIPGTLGAAPVQNIGAYGQDLSQVLVSVEAFDVKTGRFVELQKSEIASGYRKTRFNSGSDVGRFFITAVIVRLKKGELKPPFYNSLQRYIDEHNETDFSPQNIRRMVCEIRNSKLPDPETTASAGSFFKNVYLEREQADIAESKGIPLWRDENGRGKVNSGWLIEQCGLKGKTLYGFMVSDKAALILINQSAKNYKDLELARGEIIQAVKDKFGITLEQEPVEIINA